MAFAHSSGFRQYIIAVDFEVPSHSTVPSAAIASRISTASFCFSRPKKTGLVSAAPGDREGGRRVAIPRLMVLFQNKSVSRASLTCSRQNLWCRQYVSMKADHIERWAAHVVSFCCVNERSTSAVVRPGGGGREGELSGEEWRKFVEIREDGGACMRVCGGCSHGEGQKRLCRNGLPRNTSPVRTSREIKISCRITCILHVWIFQLLLP